MVTMADEASKEQCDLSLDLKHSISKLQNDIAELKQEWALRLTTEDIEQSVKQEIVQLVGAKELGLYSESMQSIKMATLKHTPLDQLLDVAHEALGADGFARLKERLSEHSAAVIRDQFHI